MSLSPAAAAAPMSPRDRFLSALRHQAPDRVPVAPDISNYIPARRTGLPFWDIYFHRKVPLWRAYADAIEHYGCESWIASNFSLPLTYDWSGIETTTTDRYDQQMDAMVRRRVVRTPDGELTSEQVCFRADPPSLIEKPIKDFARDWKAFRHLRPFPTGVNQPLIDEVRADCHGRQQAFGVCIGYPGFQAWIWDVNGGVEALSYCLMDSPEILDEWCELDVAIGDKVVDLAIACRPDYVLFGGSGTITLASPELCRRYAIPALARWTPRFRQAGIPTMLHSCGKSRALVDLLAEQTELDLVNPLEVAPMGDVDLAEVKRSRGTKLALMGNVHTVDVMLNGTPQLVRRKAIEAMAAAGEGGGFVLSTGDQCPRDTPEENLFALVDAAREYGVYDPATGTLPRLRRGTC